MEVSGGKKTHGYVWAFATPRGTLHTATLSGGGHMLCSLPTAPTGTPRNSTGLVNRRQLQSRGPEMAAGAGHILLQPRLGKSRRML